MKIDRNTVALVAYKIHINKPDGELIEFTDEKNPRPMIFGFDKVIPGFETNMLGIDEGESFSFNLSPAEAFGEYKQELMADVPKSAFEVDGKLREDLLYINNEISMMDDQGNPMKGKIVEVNSDQVKMDFNHSLAGKELFISGKVINVRPATNDDLQPQGGGCCGGGCGCGSPEGEEKHEHAHAGGDDCQVCGNPPELQGQGIGDCRCG